MTLKLKNKMIKHNNINLKSRVVKMRLKTLKKFGNKKTLTKGKMKDSSKTNSSKTRINSTKEKTSSLEDLKIRMVSILTKILRSQIKRWMPVSLTELKSLFLGAILRCNSIISLIKIHLKMCKGTDLDLKMLAQTFKTMRATKWTSIKIKGFNTKISSIILRTMGLTSKSRFTSSNNTKTGMDDNNSTDTTKGPSSPK